MKGYVCRQCNILLLEALHNARHSSTMLPNIERTDFSTALRVHPKRSSILTLISCLCYPNRHLATANSMV